MSPRSVNSSFPFSALMMGVEHGPRSAKGLGRWADVGAGVYVKTPYGVFQVYWAGVMFPRSCNIESGTVF